MDNYLIYAILYALFCVCIVFPPNEFVSSGLTLSSLFSSYLGPEIPNFVEYHIRRSCLNIFAHSCLPLGFLFVLSLNDERGVALFYEHFISDYCWRLFISFSFLLPILSICLINFYFKPDDWVKHPIVHNLRTFDSENWRRAAIAVEEEYRRIDKFVVNLGAMGRVIVTDSWIILVDPYFVHFAQQADCKLTVVSSDEHILSIESRSEVQYVKIKVEHISKALPPFTIRMTSREYREMQTKVQAPLEVARGVVIQLTLHERFVESFREHAMQNPLYPMTDVEKENLDNCIGCMQVKADVKLQKRCADSTFDIFDEEGQIIPHCRRCYCRPMWCVSCMGRWFASRQRPETVNRWLSGKSPCPTCRATFCMLDVSLVS
uniref:E3 ubiquitin-protein ligase TM129 n=1 Tax=Romanomermis culicivorax TaxID=13658 RepID=A0A915JZV4_ROMCU